MSFIADLISDIFVNAAIVKASRERIPALCVALVSLASGAAIMLYSYSLPEVSADSYLSSTISYTDVYYSVDSADPEIRLVSGPTEYTIPERIWKEHFTQNEIVRELRKDRVATVWLREHDSTEVQGIATEHFSISPELGAAWDNKNNRSGLSLGLLFLALGAVLLFVLFVFGRARLRR